MSHVTDDSSLARVLVLESRDSTVQRLGGWSSVYSEEAQEEVGHGGDDN